MVLTVRFEDTGETDTFLLGVRGAYYGDIEVYSAKSPLWEKPSAARVRVTGASISCPPVAPKS